jgi:hypothetical protein
VIKALLFVVVVIAVTAWVLAPPAERRLEPLPGQLSMAPRGAIHVHTVRSDGTGTVEEVAAAAAEAGLSFVVLTDHGDGTRELQMPRVLNGVLIIDAVEISTDGGHVVALDMPRSQYPLGGEPRDELADISRLGGFAVAAHPGSAKPELRWTDWNVPIGGLEWLNADSEWRDETSWLLLRALFTYPLRRAESVATLLDRPDAVLQRWDALTQTRRVVGLAGADAHARLGIRTMGEPYDNSANFHLPAYVDSFRAFSISLPQIVLTGNPPADAKGVMAAIRAGHVYSTVDAVGGPAAVSFTAVSGAGRASAGDALAATGPVMLRAEVQAPADAQIVLLKNGAQAAMASGAVLEQMVGPERATYRVEVRLPGAPGQPPVPWIVTNPIYVNGDPSPAGTVAAATSTAAAPGPPPTFTVQYANGPATGWTVEKSAQSLAALDVVPAVPGTQLSFRYALGGTRAQSPFAAVAMPAGTALAGSTRMVFIARADRPTRLSIQLRAPTGPEGERWHRSVYLDQMPRAITVDFADMTPSGRTSQPRPDLGAVQSVLFVVDTVNADLGSSGTIWLDDIRYGGP